MGMSRYSSERILFDNVRVSKARYDKSKLVFGSAANESSLALQEWQNALRELNDFVMHGVVPERLKDRMNRSAGGDS